MSIPILSARNNINIIIFADKVALGKKTMYTEGAVNHGF